jgi:hypothetical protein
MICSDYFEIRDEVKKYIEFNGILIDDIANSIDKSYSSIFYCLNQDKKRYPTLQSIVKYLGGELTKELSYKLELD